MTTTAITPLRQRMIEDMNARKLCAGTQRGHIRSCKRFAAFLKRSPDTATFEDIRRFQLHLADTGMSICNRNRIMTGLRFLFRVTLRRLAMVEGASLALRCGNTRAGTLAVSQPKDCWQADDHPASQSPIPRNGRCGGDQETRDGAYAAPQLRHPPARAGYQSQKDPAATRSREIGNHRALSPRRHRHDLRRREPSRPAGATKAQETQEN